MDLSAMESVENLFGNTEERPSNSNCVDIMRHFLQYYFCYIGWNETILLYNFAEDVFEVKKTALLESFKRYCEANQLPEMNVSMKLIGEGWLVSTYATFFDFFCNIKKGFPGSRFPGSDGHTLSNTKGFFR